MSNDEFPIMLEHLLVVGQVLKELTESVIALLGPAGNGGLRLAAVVANVIIGSRRGNVGRKDARLLELVLRLARKADAVDSAGDGGEVLNRSDRHGTNNCPRGGARTRASSPTPSATGFGGISREQHGHDREEQQEEELLQEDDSFTTEGKINEARALPRLCLVVPRCPNRASQRLGHRGDFFAELGGAGRSSGPHPL